MIHKIKLNESPFERIKNGHIITQKNNSDFLRKLEEYKKIKEVLEKVIDKKSSSAYVVDIESKTVSFFPLEIYAPDSPIRDSKKYIYYLSKCGNWNDLMKDIEDYKNKEN